MSDVDDIEQAVMKLAPAELAKCRAWFEALDARLFDQKIAADARLGKLDRFADQALKDYCMSSTPEL